MNKKVQISESIELGILLALSGGFMDAYSYIGRGGVFANAQTGNMLLLGVHLSEGDIPAAIRYLCPVLAFTFGIALSDIVSKLRKRRASTLETDFCCYRSYHSCHRKLFSTKP
ncbi:MAG: YoaK family protein [Anaerobutyricum soehngenii]